ncbi:hypothetical protein [Pararhodobacter sp. CCB-MM2]|uniref:hypothetical protein n=1 Tax=Pararhodobacter sp. CCB-MM2 TaxID=1786003 RepID=UPI000833D6C6|nr:hypothetical protein [Pararhodobacter sp. CCB-MM2]MCA2012756.1 hypothetical protein [Cereibacter sphaeroides]
MIFFFLRMMLFRFTPLTILLVLILTAPARAEFMGGGYLADATGCRSYGWPLQTEMVRARLNAAQIDGGQSELVLNFAAGGANTYRFRSDVVVGRRWHRVNGSVIWGRLYNLGNRTRIQILDTDNVPFVGGTPDEHTRRFRLRARIRNFNGLNGCDVTAVLMLENWNRTAD